MRGFDHDALGVRSEKIPPHRARGRPRPDFDRMRDQLLPVAA